MKFLYSYRNKGVKVELGIPYELWDKPSAEITHMKTQVSWQFGILTVLSSGMNYIYIYIYNGSHLVQGHFELSVS
jgi:hypothetical protein